MAEKELEKELEKFSKKHCGACAHENPFRNFTDGLIEYLDAKIPEVSASERLEIAEYIGNKAVVLIADMMRERDREWKQSLKRRGVKYESTEGVE